MLLSGWLCKEAKKSSPPASPTRETLKKIGGVSDDDVSKDTLPNLVLGILITPEVGLTDILRT